MTTFIFIGSVLIVLAAVLLHMRKSGVFKGDSYGNKSTMSIGDKPEEDDQTTK